MTDTRPSTLIYLYGVVAAEAPDPPPDLQGIEDRPVRLLRQGALAVPISDVPLADYRDDVLDARLADLAWVGERGIAHERVLDWFAERGPVVPLSLFSLHLDEERARARLDGEKERMLDLLASLRNRQEWRVKLWRRDSVVAEHIEDLSPTLRALAAAIDQAPPGKRYLLTRKLDAAREDEVRRVSERVAHLIYESLRTEADRSLVVPLARGAPQSGHVLVLDTAWLVAKDRFAEFQRRLGELAGEFQQSGFEFEFTGPWPPYHFTAADG